mmetsp:Transcript_1373/g.2586  ORF Transcript_1373/g.2586 Transcript_1373/m.2586 type:complete len:435 (+) Transcript_1373:41-1345(+)
MVHHLYTKSSDVIQAGSGMRYNYCPGVRRHDAQASDLPRPTQQAKPQAKPSGATKVKKRPLPEQPCSRKGYGPLVPRGSIAEASPQPKLPGAAKVVEKFPLPEQSYGRDDSRPLLLRGSVAEDVASNNNPSLAERSSTPASVKTTPRPLKRRAVDEKLCDPSPAKEMRKTPQPPPGPPSAAVLAANHRGPLGFQQFLETLQRSASDLLPRSGHPPSAVLTANHHGPKSHSMPGSSSSSVDCTTPPWNRARHGSEFHFDASSHRQDGSQHPAKRTRLRLSITTCSFIVQETLDWDYAQLTIDMRRFRDPNATAALKEHDGHNITIIERMVNHARFIGWLSWLKKELQDKLTEAEKAGRTEVRVVMFCRSGQHRALAGSVILRHLAHKLGLLCEQPQHMTARRCRCFNCRGDSPKLMDILNSVWERFRSAPCDNDY